MTAFVDGASRGNPGPAGFGVYMTTDSGEILEICGFLGTTTNNIAEYRALTPGSRVWAVVLDCRALPRDGIGAA